MPFFYKWLNAKLETQPQEICHIKQTKNCAAGAHGVSDGKVCGAGFSRQDPSRPKSSYYEHVPAPPFHSYWAP